MYLNRERFTREQEREKELERVKKMSKEERIYWFARRHNLEKYNEIPEGWRIIPNTMAPEGSEIISNVQTIKSGRRKRGLLIL